MNTTRGISIDEDKQWLIAHGLTPIREVISIPATLKKVQVGRPSHYEIAPFVPITWDQYVAEVKKIILGPIEP